MAANDDELLSLNADGCFFCEFPIRYNAWPVSGGSVIEDADGFAVCETCGKKLEPTGLFALDDFLE